MELHRGASALPALHGTARDSTGLQVLVAQRGAHCLCQAYLNNCLKLQPPAPQTKAK